MLFYVKSRDEHRIADVYGSRDYAAFSTFIHSLGPSALNAFYSIRYSAQVNTGKDRGIRPGLPLSILQLSRCHLAPDVVCGIDGIDHAAIALQLCQINGQPIDGIFQDVEHCNRHIGSFAFLRFDFNVEIAVLDGIQDSLHLFGAQDRLIQVSVHAVCLLRDGLAPITGSKHFERQYFFYTHGRGAVTAPVCASGAISPLCFPHPHSITVEQKQQNDASPDWRRLRVLLLPARTGIDCPAPT